MTDRALRDEEYRPEVRSSETVFDGAVWRIRRDRFRYLDGELTRELVDHPGAVAIMAIDHDDRVALVKQYRHPIGYRDWELPAGLLDVAGEEPLAAAQRELAEEVELEAAEWVRLTEFFTSPGGSSERIILYRAGGLSATAAFAREAEEADLELRWVPFSELLQAVLSGQVRNAILHLGVLTEAAKRSGHG